MPGLELISGGILAGLALFGEFRGLADLEVPVHVGLSASVGAGLEAAASAAGLFEVASLGAGFSAGASADAGLTFRTRVGLYYDDHHLHFRDTESLQAHLQLAAHLTAFLEARLLGFSWRKDWVLAQADLAREWLVGTDLAIDYDSHRGSTGDVSIAEADLPLSDIVGRMLAIAGGPDPTLTPLGGAGGAGAPPDGGPTPTGRSQSDPIPMTWFKPPGLYPMSIQLGDQRYFFTEPDWLPVPPGPGLDDVRRNAATDEHGRDVVRIGVAPGSRFYPEIGSVYPRVRSGAVRTGTVQDQFRRLLRAHGFDLGTDEADHVRDLQWSGEDAYENLWPLDRSHNLAANRILDQDVTYQNSAGVVVTVPLRRTPLNRYFRIVAFGAP